MTQTPASAPAALVTMPPIEAEPTLGATIDADAASAVPVVAHESNATTEKTSLRDTCIFRLRFAM
jgi:hypothetical protein